MATQVEQRIRPKTDFTQMFVLQNFFWQRLICTVCILSDSRACSPRVYHYEP